MATYSPLNPRMTLINADATTTITLPNGPPGGQPIANGYEFIVVDNNGTAGASNIAIKGPINGGTSGTSISTNYGSAYFVWDGASFIQK